MSRPALLGYMRVLSGGPDIEWQMEQLLQAGVLESSIHCDTLAVFRGDERRMFGLVTKKLKAGDTLVVPTLGIFARRQTEVFEGMHTLGLLGVALWSFADGIDTRKADPDHIFKLGEALRSAKNIWHRQNTIKAVRAARVSGNTGRRPKLSAYGERKARSLWLDPLNDKTNKQLAAEIGLSVQRLWAKFGPRPRRDSVLLLAIYESPIGPPMPSPPIAAIRAR